MLATRGVSGGRALPHPLPPGAGAGLRAAAAHRRRDRHPGPAQRRDRAVPRCRWCRSSGPWSGWPPGTAPQSSGGRWRRCPATSSTSCAGCRRWSRTAGPAPSPRRIGAITDRYRIGRRCARCGSRSPPPRCSSWSPPCRWPWSRSPSGVRLAGGVARTCTPRWSSCCSPRRRTGRCAGSARSSTRPPRVWRPSRPSDDAHSTARRRPGVDAAAAAGSPLGARATSPSPTPAGRRPAVRRRSTPCIPARGVTVHHRTVRLRQVHAARAARRPAPAVRRRRSPRPAARRRPAWQAQVAWLPQRPHFVAGTHRRQPAARPPRTPTTSSCGRRCAGSPSRSGSAPCPAASTRPLGEDGATLSAGERARLALARVVVADRPWVLLDEPTAHLDELTEQVIADTLVELGRRGAVVVVAHRPALVDAGRPPASTLPAAAVPDPAPPHRPAVASDGRVRVPRPARRRAVDLPGRRSFGLSTLLGGARLRVRRRADRHRRLADRPGLHPARRAHPAGRDRRRCAPSAWPAPCCATSSGCGRTTPRCGCWPERRVEVYDALVPLTPGRLGRRRGDLLTSIVDDVDSVVDRELRVRMPWRSYALVAALAGSGRARAAARRRCGRGGRRRAGRRGRRAAWLGPARARRAERAAVDAAGRAVDTRSSRWSSWPRELRMWQAERQARRPRSPRTSDRAGLGGPRRRPAGPGRRPRRWSSPPRASTMAAVAAADRTRGRGRHAVRADDGAAACWCRSRWPTWPLPLADAGALSVRTDAAAARLHGARAHRPRRPRHRRDQVPPDATTWRSTGSRPAGTTTAPR